MDKYSMGTRIDCRGPWCAPYGGRALCSDGKVRAIQFGRNGGQADTWFSTPASVNVSGVRVTGYISTDHLRHWTDPEFVNDDRVVVRFSAYEYRKNADRLPRENWYPVAPQLGGEG